MNAIVDGKEPIESHGQGKTRSSAFQLCGYTGFLLSFVLSLVLVRHFGLLQLTLLGITGTVILTFYILMMATKILVGSEVIIYYHHEIAVIATSAIYLRLMKQPVLPYLDILVLGLGLFLACGRIGCFMVGCCHGRPCRFGVCYGDEQANAGFPRYMVGVRLFPIQAVESILALCVVACGLTLLFKQHEPGTVLLFYVIAYGCARFCLEFFRGDAARPYYWSFSEAQWISLILAIAVLVGERARILPTSKWHILAAFSMAASMLFLNLWRHLDPSHRFELLHPHHLSEIIASLNHLDSLLSSPSLNGVFEHDQASVHIAETSRGYRFSLGKAVGIRGPVMHYSVSKKDSPLSVRGAHMLSRLIADLQHSTVSSTLVEGSGGVFHILLSGQRNSFQQRTHVAREFLSLGSDSLNMRRF